MARKKTSGSDGASPAASDSIASLKYPAKRKKIPAAGPEAQASSRARTRRMVREKAFAALSGLRSLPFPRPARLKAGQKWQVAVKVIDPRGNEGLRVMAMG
jgi:hypothetical protein